MLLWNSGHQEGISHPLRPRSVHCRAGVPDSQTHLCFRCGAHNRGRCERVKDCVPRRASDKVRVSACSSRRKGVLPNAMPRRAELHEAVDSGPFAWKVRASCNSALREIAFRLHRPGNGFVNGRGVPRANCEIQVASPSGAVSESRRQWSLPSRMGKPPDRFQC